MNLQSETSSVLFPREPTSSFLLTFMANHPWTIAIISFGSVFGCCLFTQFVVLLMSHIIVLSHITRASAPSGKSHSSQFSVGEECGHHLELATRLVVN